MPRKHKPRHKHQGIDFVVGGLRKIVKDPKSTIAQRLRALDRLAVIDGILDVKLIEPTDVTRQPGQDPEVEVNGKVDRMVAQALSKPKQKVAEEETDGISDSNERDG